MTTTDEQQPDTPSVSPLAPIQVKVRDIDSQYTGAILEDGEPITLDFVMQMINDFKIQKILHEKYAYQILLQTKDLLLHLPSLVDIDIPHGKHIAVCGDVHGQFYDLINIFEINGFPCEENPYIFNGDFVDRGTFSVEVILTLFGFKCLYPNSMFLARGNHESRCMNELYGFEQEVFYKLSTNSTLFDMFSQVFCCLPLAHVINNKVLVLHGGLFSQDGVKLSDIRGIDRFCEPPQEGLMCDLLWSDPMPGEGRGPNARGMSLTFGEDVTKKFVEDNELDLVVRSHEVKDEGYDIEHDGKLMTIFSAPNYCDQLGNKGAFVRFEGLELKYEIVQFEAVPHPEVLPEAYSSHFLSLFPDDDEF